MKPISEQITEARKAAGTIFAGRRFRWPTMQPHSTIFWEQDGTFFRRGRLI